jgi:hypothetical protein
MTLQIIKHTVNEFTRLPRHSSFLLYHWLVITVLQRLQSYFVIIVN